MWQHNVHHGEARRAEGAPLEPPTLTPASTSLLRQALTICICATLVVALPEAKTSADGPPSSGRATRDSAAGATKANYAPNDCNKNGIPDQEDLSQGTVEDANHNGQADDCDTDRSAYEWVHGKWRTMAPMLDTSYVAVRYSQRLNIRIVYSVPKGQHHVVIAVSNSESRRDTTIQDARQPSGAFHVNWRPTAENGSLMKQGRAQLEVRIDGKVYRRALAWRWRS